LLTSSRPEYYKIQLMFMSYYKKAIFHLPEDLDQREVALHTFDGKMIRHLSVTSEEELRDLIISKKPAHVYVSTASYEIPDAPTMDEKGWKRADLQFDIDVDHFEGCQSKYKICGEQIVPSKENCEGKPVPIVSESCIEKGYEEVLKLQRVLERYLGIPKESMEIHFSGNRGFHLIARNTAYDDQGSDVRREIVDFVIGNHLTEDWCLEPSCVIPRPGDPGWRGRIGEALTKLLPRGVILWRDINKDPEEMISKAKLIAKIDVDEQVTVDTSRLLRVVGSLHGKSGMKVSKVENDFRYGPHLSPFYKHDVLVKSKYYINVDVLGFKVSLKKNETAELDGSVAVYLGLRGLLEILRY